MSATELDDEAACFMGHVEGLFIGQLDPDEMRLFNDLADRGVMRRSYSGSSGFLGLAKAEMTEAGSAALASYLAPRRAPAALPDPRTAADPRRRGDDPPRPDPPPTASADPVPINPQPWPAADRGAR